MSFPRYPEYKDSGVKWLGEVPAHWAVSSLKKIVAVPITDGPHETPNFVDEGVPFVSAEAVSSGRIDFSKVRACISPEDNARYSQKYSPELHDIYMVKSGATTGITAIVEDRTDFNIWSPLAAIRCGEDALPQFVLNFMRSRNFLEAVTLNWSFGTQQNIGMGVIENLACTLPSTAEQGAIATFLDHETAKIDALVAEQEKLIALLKEKRQAVISHAVTKGLNPDAPMKDSGIEWLGEVPAHWELKRLKYLGEAIIGLTYSPADIVDEGSGTLVFRSSNVQGGEIAFDDNVYVTTSIPAELVTRTGDILICSRNGSRALIGKNAVIDERSAGVTFGAFMTIYRSQYSAYIAWILNSRLFEFQSGAFMTSTINQLTVGVLNGFEIPFPPSSERDKIAAFLHKETAILDALKADAEEAIALLKERRSALISAAVTGKIDVREFA